MNELALFAGAGGGILGGHLLGWRTICAVEWEPYPASVLAVRQNEKILPTFPIWDDVQTFDGKPWRGIVDVISGGFPCQDISVAGKGAGIDGKRSGMWQEMARIVSEIRPQYVFVENSPMLITRGLNRVLGDLTEIGYDTKWLVMGAADIGAPHKRDRIWILGTNASGKRCDNGCIDRKERYFLHDVNRNAEESKSKRYKWIGGISSVSSDVANSAQLFSNGSIDNAGAGVESETQSESGNDSGSEVLANSNSPQCKGNERSERINEKHSDFSGSSWWSSECGLDRVANGMADRVDRLKAIGNGQVSGVAAKAFKILSKL